MRIVFPFIGFLLLLNAGARCSSTFSEETHDDADRKAKSSKSHGSSQATPSKLAEIYTAEEKKARDSFSRFQSFLVPLNEFLSEAGQSVRILRNAKLQAEFSLLLKHYNSPELVNQISSAIEHDNFLFNLSKNILSFAARLLEKHVRNHEAEEYAKSSALGPSMFILPPSHVENIHDFSRSIPHPKDQQIDRVKQQLEVEIERMTEKAKKLAKLISGLETIVGQSRAENTK